MERTEMKKAGYLSIVVGLMLCFILPLSYAFDQSQLLTAQQLEDLEIEVNGLKINNFDVYELKARAARGLMNLEVSCSVRNRSDATIHFGLMIVGFNKEGNALWAMELHPMAWMLPKRRGCNLDNAVYVPPGTLKKTSMYWVRVVTDR